MDIDPDVAELLRDHGEDVVIARLTDGFAAARRERIRAVLPEIRRLVVEMRDSLAGLRHELRALREDVSR